VRVPNSLETERKEKDKTLSVARVDKINEGRGTLSSSEDNGLTGVNLVEGR